MKLLTWNVNGLRAVLGKGFVDWFNRERPDILCLQETKVQDGQVQLGLPGYKQYFSHAEKKGYSGTAVFTNKAPLKMTEGMGIPEQDREGRIITLEFDKYFLVNVYTPNAQRSLDRLPYRQGWDRDFLAYLKKLEKKKPVIACGDFNVAHGEIDLANPKQNQKNAGFTAEEREGFQRYIDSGLIDTFREFNREGGNFTWWSYMFNARARNIGWRIDYFLISKSLRPMLKDAFILADVMGSDHCPAGIEII
jgi:exodeoxyribonuclease-3